MRPYSIDLRSGSRGRDEDEGPQEIARLFRVSVSFVSRLCSGGSDLSFGPLCYCGERLE